ncbi:MAG: response regulator, partial [Acidobacteria bacterium]|nr:response regulator [Acidobacteriota bacterium]
MAASELPRILVVDDESEHLVILRKILEEEEYAVQTCSSGSAALQKLREGSYDAILCDMWMPGITGIGLFHLIQKEFPQYEHRFIFITADRATETTRTFIQGRNLPYVIKPF